MGASFAAAQARQPLFVAWMRQRQIEQRRHQPVVLQRHATVDASESGAVHDQEQVWAQRHAHERRLHDSAIAQLRHE